MDATVDASVDDVAALGLVITDDRGSLPFSLVHGEALAAAAAWALGEAGVQPVDLTVPWESLREAAEPVVLHDSLCPLTPPEFLARCVALAVEHGEVVVGVRPVTDTVKRVDDGEVRATVDREQLVTVCSPVVLPGPAVASLEALPTLDFPALVAALERLGPVRREVAPSAAHRVAGSDDIRLLEALTKPLRNL
jgi:2-C-methyl-D-erythritol 4-phosphate cytidylyltransferase